MKSKRVPVALDAAVGLRYPLCKSDVGGSVSSEQHSVAQPSSKYSRGGLFAIALLDYLHRRPHVARPPRTPQHHFAMQ